MTSNLPPAYHFDSGEFFFTHTSQATQCSHSGNPVAPDWATLIEPPSLDTTADEIAVFVPMENRWEMRPNNFWTPTITEVPVYLGNPLDGVVQISQYALDQTCIFPGIPKVLFTVKQALAMSARLAYMQERLTEILAIDNLRRQPAAGLAPMTHYREKFSVEELVLNMKRVVDEIFMNQWVKLESESARFKEDHLIRVCEMQDLDKLPAGETKQHLAEMRDADPIFFRTLTDLRNSFVHHYPVSEVYESHGVHRPIVITLHVPKGRLTEMRLISINLEDLVKSFNRFLERTFGPARPPSPCHPFA